jgi:hypothetical protein
VSGFTPGAGIGAPPESGATSSGPEVLDNGLLLACGLSWLCALIHVQAAVDHFDEYVPYSLAFLAVSALQLAWGVGIYRRPSRRLFVTGAVLSLGVALAWLCSRVAGLPLGPDTAGPESVGLLDGVATGDELLIVALMTIALGPALPGSLQWLARRLRSGAARYLTGGLALAFLVLSSAALAGGFHAH